MPRAANTPDSRFSFVVISDRTGSARPGVFERGLAATDLLAPSFAVQLGDLIEGYTVDPIEIVRQWDHIDTLMDGVRTPVVRVPGNHDVANDVQRRIWRERYGPTWGGFRYADALIMRLDTQDPPDEDAEQIGGWDDLQPAVVSGEQLDGIAALLEEHRDVRWTFVCMHMPLWQGDHPAWGRLRRMLASRPYTAVAGHVHNYRHTRIGDRSHVRLGPTGGGWVIPDSAGNFDHVTQIVLTEGGPIIANILLDGLRDIDGQLLRPGRAEDVAGRRQLCGVVDRWAIPVRRG